MEILKPVYLIPIEREFESWIIEGIENYFEQIGKRISCFAISPALEKVIPSDDFFEFEGKLIGLQMKRPKIVKRTAGIVDYSNLCWDLNDSSNSALTSQYDKIRDVFPEIYYCLPIFINRTFKKIALHHCLFWRPQKNDTDKKLWYDNENQKVKTKHKKIKTAKRWGLFIEEIMACNIGKVIKNKSEFISYFEDKIKPSNEDSSFTTLVFIKIEMKIS